MNRVHRLFLLFNSLFVLVITGCVNSGGFNKDEVIYLDPKQKHYKFSQSIDPIITVKSGSIISTNTEEASDNRIYSGMSTEDYRKIEWGDFGHPLSGPIYVENAKPGDILSVTLHEFVLGDWGWTDSSPHFSYLKEEVGHSHLKTYKFNKDKKYAYFSDTIKVPLKPFAGVMGVAPATSDMLSTIPPRANGGNMDDPNIVAGTTVHFPVFVEGALFSIGDTHAAQGHGEVSGTAIEAPMQIIFELNLIKNPKRVITEPEYETDEYYAVTAFAKTLDEAAKKATRFMVKYLQKELNLPLHEANMLSSVAADLKIAEVVDGNVLVSMHIPKSVINQ